MENNEMKNNNSNNERNWKTIAANWGKRVLWATVGAGITIGIQALRNRKNKKFTPQQ